MKHLLVGSFLLFSSMTSVMACEEQVLTAYTQAFAQNENHALIVAPQTVLKNQKTIVVYGKTLDLNYEMDIELHLASSEYMGGYGVEAIMVDPASCRVLDIVNVYTE